MTAKQRNTASAARANAAQETGVERQHELDRMTAELAAASQAKKDGGWLSSITDALDAATDAIVGGNALEDVTHELAKDSGCEAFNIAYDFLRPDALVHGAVVVSGAASGQKKGAQIYDVTASSSSLKTRSQGAADITGEQDVMVGYAVTRDAIAGAAVTVGTCGTGTVAVVAMATSAALMLEAKTDALGKAGASDKEKMWMRLGAQAALVLANGVSAVTTPATDAQRFTKAAVLMINGANQMARGSVAVGHAVYDHEADEHLADAAMHEAAQQRADRAQQRIASGLREVAKAYQQSLETLAGTMNERDQSSLQLARSIA
jgi:hypothetical protein